VPVVEPLVIEASFVPVVVVVPVLVSCAGTAAAAAHATSARAIAPKRETVLTVVFLPK
jgi:Mg/Co/Ni transporter MgtE